jgi:sterol desaturase/sphingolipid hydroxylase (fatty acid hydroxylase superfamily)
MAKNFVSNKDETVRMFKSDLLEKLSKVHFSIPLFVYIPISAYFLYRSLFIFNLSAGMVVLYFLIGLFVWTLTEYLLHRFIFHYKPKSKYGERIHFIFHGVHHDYPNDSKRLVMPPSVSLPLAAAFYLLFNAIFGAVLVAPFFVGFIIGYLFYDMTHYAIHHYNMHSKFWLMLKKHHMRHHYQDSSRGFGVSIPIWDKVIGTDFDQKTK